MNINSNINQDNSNETNQNNTINLQEFLLNEECDTEIVEKAKEIFSKSDATKKVTENRYMELDSQFNNLKERLNSTSSILLRIKKNIDNVKISYEKSFMKMHKCLNPDSELMGNPFESSEEMTKYIEEMERKIEVMQSTADEQTDKFKHVAHNYEEAFNRAVQALEDIKCKNQMYLN